jgi:hypothetical protein
VDVELTCVKIVLNDPLNITLLGIVNSLVLQVLALSTHAVSSIHTLLELIVLPAKHIVAMLAKTSVVAVAEIEGVGVTRLPLAVEWGGVPDNFVHELWDADGMCRGAVSSEAEEVGRTGGRIGDVGLVVGAVEIYTVPAAGVSVR